MRRLILAACALAVPLSAWAQAPRPPSFVKPPAFTLETSIPVADGFTPAMLQALVNPTIVEFTASPDHAATVNTVAVVTRYDLKIYNAKGPTLVKTQDLGKPTPNASNLISYAQLRTVLSTLAPGDYLARVAAVGPGGTGESANSNPFQIAAPAPGVSGTPVVR